jgi:hypothetical protein
MREGARADSGPRVGPMIPMLLPDSRQSHIGRAHCVRSDLPPGPRNCAVDPEPSSPLRSSDRVCPLAVIRAAHGVRRCRCEAVIRCRAIGRQRFAKRDGRRQSDHGSDCCSRSKLLWADARLARCDQSPSSWPSPQVAAGNRRHGVTAPKSSRFPGDQQQRRGFRRGWETEYAPLWTRNAACGDPYL